MLKSLTTLARTTATAGVDSYETASTAMEQLLRAYRPTDTLEPGQPDAYRWVLGVHGEENYQRGLADYGCSVAVEQNGQWLAAAVATPNSCWYASAGHGAWLRGGGQLSGPPARRKNRILATGFSAERRRFQSAAVHEFLQEFTSVHVSGAGAIDIMRVASGGLDAGAYYGLDEQDWAAAALIAEQAGLKIRRPRWRKGEHRPDWLLIGELTAPELDPDHVWTALTQRTLPGSQVPKESWMEY